MCGAGRWIVRELHVSCNTVRKILRFDETDFSYGRERQPLPKTGAWKAEIERFVAANEGKPSRERLTLIRIYKELRALGYDGSYDAVRRYAKLWSKDRRAVTAEAYVPLYYAPGEAYQFDWSHVMVFDAHYKAFDFFRGTCTRGIYDNMKTAVEAVFLDKERLYNRRFLQMCSHYLVHPLGCTPTSGWEKGQVENQVGLVRERFLTPRLRVKSLEELNLWLLDKCTLPMPRPVATLSRRRRRSGRCSRPSVVASYVTSARSTVSTAVHLDVEDLHRRFDNNKYSVLSTAVGRPVESMPMLIGSSSNRME